MSLETEEEKEAYKKQYPEINEVLAIVNEIDENNISPFLANARAIKEWIEKSGETKPPSQTSTDKAEKRLGIALNKIRQRLIKPYMSLETEEEKEAYKKQHPKIDEVLEIIKPPSSTSTDKAEKRLGNALSSIRQYLIKPYIALKTEEEQKIFSKQHPEIDEVLAIVNEIDENNISPYLANAREIKEWIEKSGETKPPSKSSIDKTEKRLGKALSTVRQRLIKPYISLETEEEKEAYKKQHPEIDEVLDIISELDIQCGTQKQKELAILIRQDLEKRQALEKARKLEQDYEYQLSSKIGEITKNTQDKE